jgi:aryl-alcohol dehydrogenase-like predicted oxidoreductase
VSVLGLGCRRFGDGLDEADTTRLVRSALDLGVTLFDTANVYGGGTSEHLLGRALRGVRDRAVVATKARWAVGSGPNDRGASRVHLRAAVEDSLRRLATDRIDLFQVHAPDPVTPLEETVSAIDDLVACGKVLYAGTSNFAGWQVVEAHWQAKAAGRRRFVSTQAPYSLLDTGADAELLPAARRCGVGFLACLTLARGYLAGAFGPDTDPATLSAKQRAYLTERHRRRYAEVAGTAERLGVGTAALSLAAVADVPGIASVLVGTSDPARLAENARAVGQSLSSEDSSALFAGLRAADAEPLPPRELHQGG